MLMTKCLRKYHEKNDQEDFSDLSMRELNDLKESLRDHMADIRRSMPFGDHLKDREYLDLKRKLNLVESEISKRETRFEKEPYHYGKRYYLSRSIENGTRFLGEAVIVKKIRGQDNLVRVKVNEDIRVLKALEVLKEGETSDFFHLYFKYANGLPDGAVKYDIDHIRKSTNEALCLMENYIQKKYPNKHWSWEENQPEQLKRLMENEKMKNLDQYDAEWFRKMILESEQEEEQIATVVTLYNYLLDKANSAVNDIANISKMGVEALASGDIDDERAEKLRVALGEPLDAVIEAMSNFITTLKEGTYPVEAEEETEGEDVYMDDMDDEMDMGSIEDAMGEKPEREMREE